MTKQDHAWVTDNPEYGLAAFWRHVQTCRTCGTIRWIDGERFKYRDPDTDIVATFPMECRGVREDECTEDGYDGDDACVYCGAPLHSCQCA